MRRVIFPDVKNKFLMYATSVFAGTRQYDSLYGPFPLAEDAFFFAREKLRPRRMEEDVELEIDPEKILLMLKLFVKNECERKEHAFLCAPAGVFFRRNDKKRGEARGWNGFRWKAKK